MPILRENGPEVILDIMEDTGFDPIGIMHIGANEGYEVIAYEKTRAKNVLYVEAIPEIYESCKKRVDRYPGHRAILAVCSSKSGEFVTFNVSSNKGMSSSMLALGEHAEIYPSVEYTDSFISKTTTADEIINAEDMDHHEIDYLVLDVQGSELEVLKGCSKILAKCRYVVCEVSEFPLYEGGCTLNELNNFLFSKNYEIERQWLRGRPGKRVGDVVYVKVEN